MKPYASYKPSGVPWLGDVPSDWSVEKLKFFAKFVGGGTPSKDEPIYWGGEIPWVSPKDMKRPLIRKTEDYITSEGLGNSPCTLIPPFSVLTVVRSGILQHTIPVALNTVPVALNQDMRAVIPDGRVDSRYLAYQIEGCQRELREEWVKQGATVESIEHQRMIDSRLAVPSPDEQQAIADYLDAETVRIDTLIHEKDELIGLLKEARSSTIIEAVSRGVCPSAPLKSSGLHFLGNVPTHWEKFKVAHAFGTSSGTTPPTDEPEWYEGDVPWVQSSELRENIVFSTEKKVTVEAVQKFSALKIYPVGTLLLAMYGATIGRVGLLGVPATTNQACCALRPLGQISTKFFCWWLQAYREELVARGYGGGQPNVSATLISGMYFFAPHPDEQKAIADYLDTETAKIDDLIAHTHDEIGLLKELRTATIADAVLGRIDVRGSAKTIVSCA